LRRRPEDNFFRIHGIASAQNERECFLIHSVRQIEQETGKYRAQNERERPHIHSVSTKWDGAPKADIRIREVPPPQVLAERVT
jgi:hypothetical protein